MSNQRTSVSRIKNGNIIEFGPCAVVLFCFVLIPLISIAIVPIRYLTALCAVKQEVHKLAQQRSRNYSYQVLRQDHRWIEMLAHCGVDLRNQKLQLIVDDGRQMVAVTETQPVDQQFMANSQSYLPVLELSATAYVQPVFPCGNIPLFGAPVAIPLRACCCWENLAKDPDTNEYYINE